MAKEICISTTPHETRLAILEDDQLAEIYYERENEYTLAGSIYKGRVTRVLPGMQSSFVDVGLERDAFLYVTDFLEEQEDSEEYETSGGNGQARRGGSERSPSDEAQSTPAMVTDDRRGRRESRRSDGRKGEGRPDRGESGEPAPRTPAQEERAASSAALRTAQPTEIDQEEKGDTETPEGTRRWRGRRGRRRGGMRAGVLGVAAGRDEDSGSLPQTAAAPFSLPEHGAPGGLASPSAATREISFSEVDEPEEVDGLQGGAGFFELQASAMPGPPLRSQERRRSPDVSTGVAASLLPGESLSKYGSAPTGASSEAPVARLAAAPAVPARPVNYTAPKPATMVETVGGWDGGALLPGETISRYKAAAAPEPGGLDQVAAESEPAQVSGAIEASEPFFAEGDASSAPVVSQSASMLAPEAGTDAHAFQSERTTGITDLNAQGVAAALEGFDQVAGVDTPADTVEPGHAAEPSAQHYAEILPEVAPEIAAEAMPGAEHAEHLTTTAEPIAEAGQTLRAIAESEAPSVPENSEAEYEPKDGEASVRISPPATSELRLSQLFGGSEMPARISEEEKGQITEDAAVTESLPESPYGESSRMQAWDFKEPARSTLNAGSEVQVPAPTAEANDEFVGASELPPPETAVFGTPLRDTPLRETPLFATPLGEASMQSMSFPAVDDEPSGVHGHALDGLRDSELGAPGSLHGDALGRGAGFAELVDQLQGFAPGSGLLEEEVIDEDEYDFEPIHAGADDQDLEDLEEETLEGAYGADDLEPERDGLRMEDASVEENQDHEEDQEEDLIDRAAFALEEIDEDEVPNEVAAGEPSRSGNGAERERNGERSREEGGRRGGRNGRRRGPGGNGGGSRRQSAQTQDLPIISDLLKQGQEILVQIAKEPIAKKGARITSHIALPGRFLVFMPTVSHVGVSRKIDSDEERQRLKRILISEKGDSSGGFIVRTAAEGASEEELRADLRFLISLWAEIKQRSDTAKAPALIYHDLNLVERILRDQVSSNFSTIWVDTEQEYERIVRFLNRFQPSLVRRVKLYIKETPLFEHFGIQEEITKALKSKVWLKSGGSIVINQTEALVAIDINTGKYVGKTARLEDTIVKTNLDAIPEIVRQIRLRDLGGIIVIDFIDMDERKNRHRVLAALEEAMKVDRAPSKVLQFNDFGLVAITRKRVKQSLERTLSVQCDTCAGTGMVKSPVTVCNEIYIELRKMLKHLEGKDVLLRVNPEVVKQLKGANGRWINEYEEMVGKTIIIKSDPSLHPEQFDIH